MIKYCCDALSISSSEVLSNFEKRGPVFESNWVIMSQIISEYMIFCRIFGKLNEATSKILFIIKKIQLLCCCANFDGFIRWKINLFTLKIALQFKKLLYVLFKNAEVYSEKYFDGGFYGLCLKTRIKHSEYSKIPPTTNIHTWMKVRTQNILLSSQRPNQFTDK